MQMELMSERNQGKVSYLKQLKSFYSDLNYLCVELVIVRNNYIN